MLKKLLKYDLKWVYKVIIVFYVLSIFFSLAGRLFGIIDNSIMFKIISDVSIGIAISMMANSLINSIIRLWVRFIRNVYKDEAYLTHTLPVKKSDIFNSKVLTAVVIIFITTIVIVLSLFLCFYSSENLASIKNFLNIAANLLDSSVLRLLLLVSLTLFLEIMQIVLIGFVAIIFGHQYNRGKMVKTVFIGFGVYMVVQIISLGLVLLAGLFDAEIMNLIKTSQIVNFSGINKILLGCILLFSMYNAILFLIGKKALEKGVNLE